MKTISRIILRLLKWKIIGELPDLPKYLGIAAPHTTNWDWFFMLLFKFSSGFDFHWVGKDSLFKPPFGFIMKGLGGVPVNRSVRANFVDQIVEQYRLHDRFAIALTPEGTRGKASFWKTGFYFIALGAKIPILMISDDYPSRTIEIGPLLYPTGDIQADFDLIRKFYAGKRGKFPQYQGEIRLRSEMQEIEP
jgi:1-acyl-sn-glycerol-3-phosphate acyltransferase